LFSRILINVKLFFRFFRAIRNIVFDVTQKKEMRLDLKLKNKILDELSRLDGLTKVKNISEFFEHLKAAIRRGLV